MTAAVARPPLFSHLVASRPDREKGSAAATVTSIAIHGVLITAAIVLGARMSAPQQPEAPAPFIILPNPIAAPPSASTPSVGGGGPIRNAEAPPAVPLPPTPYEIPSVIPKPGIGLPDDPSKAFRYEQPIRSGVGAEAGVSSSGGAPGNFVAITKKPELINRAEVERILQRYYPVRLLQAGIGGTVVVWVQIDEAGKVLETRVSKPSAHPDFDVAALNVGRSMRFSPAYNREVAVKVWVELPIVFGAK